MKRIILSALVFLTGTTLLQAQLKSAPKKVLELKMPKTAGDDMPGTRGASVVWHPVQKKYYAVMAGNAEYPLAVFDVAGKRLSGDDLKAMNDSRGLWYNPDAKEIQGNGYAETGWYKYILDYKGIPESSSITIEGSHQPTEQCVGTFNPVRKEVMFLKENIVSLYSPNGVLSPEYIEINLGKKKAEDDPGISEEYNNTTVIYTGMKNAELGFLNVEKKQVELYDLVSGFLMQKIKLPEDVPAEYSFNFSYANGIYWLFDIKARTWYGYR